MPTAHRAKGTTARLEGGYVVKATRREVQVAATIALLFVAGCRSPNAATAPAVTGLAAARSRLDLVRARGELRIGTTGDYKPYSFRNGNVLEGIDIDLGRDLAASLGVAPRFVPTSWPTLLEDLERDRFDLAMSGISRTQEREGKGLFSEGYAVSGKTPIGRCSDREHFDSFEKIDGPGVRVLVNPGGTNERFARAHLRRAELIVFSDNRSIFAELAANRGDVMFTDADEVRLQTRGSTVLCAMMPGREFEPREKAVLMPKDVPLQQGVNRWLRALKDRGVLRDVFRRHLGD